ncbi:MAG: glycosyltransferase [Planctomycetota bacterium]|nr:glycosyltransferase [Planctomycetota bacterium]
MSVEGGAMRVAHYLPSIVLAEGGVVRAVLDMAGGLASRGHRVDLITCNPADVPAEWKAGKPLCPRVLTVDAPLFDGGLLPAAAIRKAEPIFREADVVHLHAMWTTSNLQFARLSRRHRKPYILSVHGMLDDWCMAQRTLKKRLYLSIAGSRLLHDARFVHCTAEAELQQSVKFFPADRGRVIPLVFDTAPFQHLPGPERAREKFGVPVGIKFNDPTNINVLFLSRIHPKKGCEKLLETARILSERLEGAGRTLRVFFAGTGDAEYVEEIKARAQALGLGERAKFLGMVTGADKLALFEACDLFVLPTSQENFGFVFFEAMACRTPVVTTRGVDVWPELEASAGARIIDPYPPSLADAVAALINDGSLLRRMGEAGREWTFGYLSASRTIDRFESMYAAAIGRGT